MAELLIVTGPPGAGKSTVAAQLASHREPSVLVEGDAFFAFLRRGRIDPWLPESDDQNTIVTDVAAGAAGRFAASGYWTVYDGVLGPWFLPRFVAASGLASVHYAVLLPPVDMCVSRVRSRIGHGFTDRVATEHMHQEFADTTATLDARHVLRDAADAATLAARIATAVDAGHLTLTAP